MAGLYEGGNEPAGSLKAICLPQGSVLSPLLYTLYVGDIKRTLHSPLQILHYVDDIVLYQAIPREHNTQQILSIEQESQRFIRYLEDLGFSVNNGKD
ncbi:hypothetical protein ANN_19172 [Periplaneta americana]|uniref:Reverse transcriptase domain-containing protein n=1 Tax=Periplaneta americana TaxID=6978 RepID=A0ABQ8S942_PERAM|nr:hypothetical protein ANN_19172 [Periplaneta americana]